MCGERHSETPTKISSPLLLSFSFAVRPRNPLRSHSNSIRDKPGLLAATVKIFFSEGETSMLLACVGPRPPVSGKGWRGRDYSVTLQLTAPLQWSTTPTPSPTGKATGAFFSRPTLLHCCNNNNHNNNNCSSS